MVTLSTTLIQIHDSHFVKFMACLSIVENRTLFWNVNAQGYMDLNLATPVFIVYVVNDQRDPCLLQHSNPD